MLLALPEVRDIIPNVLKHLDIAPDRDITEHFVSLGVIAREQYNKHWLKQCSIYARDLPLLPLVDYGWLFCMFTMLKRKGYLLDPEFSRELYQDGDMIRLNRRMKWYISIELQHGKIGSIQTKCRFCLSGEMIGTRACSGNHDTSTIIFHFFNLFSVSHPEMVRATFEYICAYLPMYITGNCSDVQTPMKDYSVLRDLRECERICLPEQRLGLFGHFAELAGISPNERERLIDYISSRPTEWDSIPPGRKLIRIYLGSSSARNYKLIRRHFPTIVEKVCETNNLICSAYYESKYVERAICLSNGAGLYPSLTIISKEVQYIDFINGGDVEMGLEDLVRLSKMILCVIVDHFQNTFITAKII